MIRIPISQAKRLGYSIKGYVFTKDKKVPYPVIEKAKVKKQRKKRKKIQTIPLEQEGNVYRLKLT